MKIGLLFNCQGQGIAAALEALLPGCTVTNYQAPAAGACVPPDDLAALLASDYIVSAPMGADAGAVANDRLRGAVRNFHILPPLSFRGFHPDTIHIRDGGGHSITGPTGAYHSRIAVAAYLGGLSAEDATALYNALVFSRLGYLRRHAEDYLLIEERFARFGLDTGNLIGRLRAGGCFMHSVNHPKRWALFELARMACRMIGETPVDVAEESVPDFLAAHGIHPVFAEIAHRIGVAPEGMFRAGIAPGLPPRALTTVDFVRGSFKVFRDVHPDFLFRADGVAAAMAALDLTMGRPARGAVSSMAFLTGQGTLLHVHKAAGAGILAAQKIIHLPVAGPGAGSDPETSLLCMEFDPASLPVQWPELAGVELRPGCNAGLIAITRKGAFLGIDPATANAAFRRDAPGDGESFLPVRMADLEPLRALLSGVWQQEAEPVPVKPPPARMAGSFTVQLGTATIDLRQSWPRALPPNEAGESRLAVLLDGVPATLRGPKAEVAEAVRTARPPPRMELGRRLAMVGAKAWLHPPLTVSTADRLWLHERCGNPLGLPWQEEGLHIEVRREAGRLVGAGAWRDGEPEPGPRSGDALAGGRAGALPWLASPCVLIDAPPVPDGASLVAGQVLPWMEPLMRLLTLVPHLPPGAGLLVPQEAATEAALTQVWQGMRLPSLPWARLPAPTCVAQDLTWADAAASWEWPAEALRSVRGALLGDASPGDDLLFLRGPEARRLAGWPDLEQVLKRNNYTTLDLACEPPAAILARLRRANRIMGAGADLLVSVFCPPGTKVIELSADAAFQPAAWRQSCALGLPHAVLPCPETKDGLQVDAERLSALNRMVAQMSGA